MQIWGAIHRRIMNYFGGLSWTKQQVSFQKRRNISWLVSLINLSSFIPSVLAQRGCDGDCPLDNGDIAMIAVAVSMIGALIIIAAIACYIKRPSKVEEADRGFPMSISITVADPVVATPPPHNIPDEYDRPPAYFDAVYNSNYPSQLYSQHIF